MLNASVSLLLIQLANDVDIQPFPGQAQSLNGLRIQFVNGMYII